MKIKRFEPWFFMFFGLFHGHRVWGLLDRGGYAAFWLGVLEEKSVIYYSLMGILALFCLYGIGCFIQNRQHRYWWQWIYLLGGGYVLFDLTAIWTGWPFWQRLLHQMFNTSIPYWNLLWGSFVIVGMLAFGLGVSLARQRQKQQYNVIG